ncbi:MAG: glycosyltransferase family 2 protein [Desulfobacterales bacterium]
MHPEPKVTVIIPCYNRERYIEKTVESVLSQTIQNIELIVVDDGCTDNSRQILEQYKDCIRILEHPGRINKGQSAALNLGIVASRGEYVAFLDSDDLFAPEKIEKQVKFLEAHPEIGLVYANGHTIDENGTILHRIYGDNHHEESDPNRVLLDCYFLLPNNSLVRKDVLLKAGFFDESFRSAQDHDLAIRIAEITRIAYLDEPLFFYRRHKESISRRNAMLRWKNGFRILNKARLRYNYRVSTLSGRLAVLNFRLGQCYREEGQYFKAVMFFIAAGLCDPVRSMGVLTGREKVSGPH